MVWSWRWLDELSQDVRIALRTLRKDWIFSAAVLGTLAVGLAASAVVISIIATMLRFALADPERLVLMQAHDTRRPNTRVVVTSFPDFVDWRDQTTSFDGVAAYSFGTRNLTGLGEAARLAVLEVTPNVHSVLGLRPAEGRGFTPMDSGQSLVVSSYQFWQQHLGGKADAIGTTVTLNGQAHTVIGVLPKDLPPGDLRRLDVWLLIDESEARAMSRGERRFAVWARLGDGVPLEAAQAELDIVTRRLEEQYPDTDAGWGVRLIPFSEALLNWESRVLLSLLVILVTLVVFVGCGNVATLSSARAESRRGNVAIRTALGARRARLVRQALTEASLLSVAAGSLGALAAFWGIRVAASALADSNTLLAELRFDGSVFALTLAVAMLTPFLFGLLPALAVTRPHVGLVLGSRSDPSGRIGPKRRTIVVASEVAVAILVVVLAGLGARTAVALRQIELGFRADRVLTMRTERTDERYSTRRAQIAFYSEVLQAVEQLPGIRAAAVASHVPIGDREPTALIEIEGRAGAAGGTEDWAARIDVSPKYTEVLGIPLLAGDSFDPRALESNSAVALINQTMARRFWPAGNAVGARIRFRADMPDDSSWLTVIGVVGDVRNSDADQPRLPQVYVPYIRQPTFSMALLVQTNGDPLSAAPEVRQALWSVDPEQPLYDVRSMGQVLFDDFADGVVFLGIFAVLALIALLLAASGVYSVLSLLVSTQVREVGIRIALGATTGQVQSIVIRQALAYATFGIVAGVVLALGTAALLASQLYGVSPSDPLTYAAGVSLVLVVVAIASWLPAWRVTRIDPVVALRAE